MSTPTFLEKLDEYIECLDNAAELAFQHSNEIGLADDYTPICDKCHKRRKLDFDESFPKLQDDSFISDSSFENSYSKSLIRNSKTRLLSRQGSLKDDSRNDKTFVSAMLKTLVTLNSSSESLNLSSNHNPSSNETTRAKKGTFLKRRHTLLDENAFMLSANANAAVSIAKTNTELPTTNKAEISGAKKDNSAILRSKVSRRPRPLSYPNRQYLLRQATAHNLCKDNMSQIGAKISCDASAGKEEVSLSGPSEMTSNNINNNINTTSRNCAKQLNRSQPISIKTSTNEGRSHQIYYSLSPTLLDAPLRLAELGKTTSESTVVVKKLDMGFEDSANGVLGIGDLENNETNQLSYDSSLSSNPEYFSVISKRKKRLRKKLQNNQSGSKFGSHFLQNNHLESEFGSHSLPANISKADDTDKTRSTCDRTQAPGMQDLRTLHGRQCSQSLDDLTNRNLERTQLSDLDMTLDSGNTSYLHGDGLLYTSSFGIGDHGWCSNLGDSDMAIDGYCKCSFCNHDMILTPMKSETQVIPPGNDVYEKDFATMHDELLRLRSTSNNSMTSLHTSHYEPRTDLQTDHFPYPRLPKEFMTSQNDASVTSQLDISMEIACSCDEDSTAGDNNSMRVSPIQKALQRDIEKHSSGVASVLNLCEVLLHDGDACSNDSEKDSIEQATSSLDRRWRNICSLSMGRKLKIEETQRLWRKFMEDYSRFNDWLKLAENVVSHPNSSEVAYAVAREELKKFESFQRQVHESLTQLELINKQYRRLARENRTDATNKLKHMIHDGNSRWDAISHRVTAIMRRLKHTICRRDEFETSRESLVVWLTETDLRLTNVEHFSQSENFDKLKEVKALQRDIEKHSSGVASVLNLCEVLLHDGDACSNDSEKDSIEQATSSLDRRWRNICSLSMGRKLKIEETQRLWRKFMEDYSRFNDWLKLAENVVSHPNSSEVAYAVAREELKKFESFQRQVHESLTQLELINKQYRRLARENRTDATNKLKHMIHDGNSRWDAISHRVTAIMRRLKHTICRRDEFETSRESLVVWLTETDLRLTNVEHFSQSENFDKLKEVKNFQATIEEHIPRILQLDIRGQLLIEKSEGLDSVIVEEELSELHRYCKEVVARLDRYHKRLLRIMNEPSPLDSSLFEDTELAQMNWFESYIGETSSSRNSSPGSLSPDHDRLLATPRSQQNGKLHSSRHSNGSHSGRATPESLEWDLYDISQSELETKDNGALTDDGSIPEISPLEEDDDIPLLHISRDSNYSRDNASRRSYDRSTSLDNDDLSPSKKLRTSQDDQRTQFMNDLVATMAWLDATIKVTDQEKKKSESNFDKTIGELEQEVKEQRTLQKSLEQRKPIVLSIRLVSSSFCDDDITKRLSRMNKNWESLQQKSIDWNKSLQESLLRSQEFQITVSQLTSWVDLQTDRRDDMSMIQQRESADSSPTSKMQKLRRDHKVLDQMRIDTLEAVSKVTTLQDICIQLTKSSKIVPPVDGTRAVSDKVRSTNGRLKSLLDAVRSDLRDVEYKIKATRRRVREEQSSESDAESSEDKIRSNRLRMLKTKLRKRS